MSSLSVAFAVNNSYVPHLEVALFSLIINNSESHIYIYIISLDITTQNKDKLRHICKRFKNTNIEFIEIDKNTFADFTTLEHFSFDMYSRYLLPKLLPDQDRVLYLDADILVTGDIRELYESDLHGYYAAGVKDLGISKNQFKDYLKKIKLDGNEYFNSGVLLFNLSKMREENKTEELMTETSRLLHLLRHPDQDIINLVLRGRIKSLDRKWNSQDEDRRRDPNSYKDAIVVHYTTEFKPWNTPNILRSYNSAAHAYYEAVVCEYLDRYRLADEVSIIIPVYNTPVELLEECICSVVNQIYKKIEILIVDDGSNAKTSKHLDSIGDRDQRIKVIHKKNAGTNRARQTGFQESTGKYITFVDSDDVIEPNYVLKLLVSIINTGSDISVAEYWDGIDVKREASLSKGVVMDNRDDIANSTILGIPGVRLPSGVLWSKIYRRELIECVDWTKVDYKITEDEFFTTKVFSQVNRLSTVPDQLYYYRRELSSSKEYQFPQSNLFNGRPIPILRTVIDLYEFTKNEFDSMGIKYKPESLLNRYIWMLDRFMANVLRSGEMSDDNKRELTRQSRAMLNRIQASRKISNDQKIRSLVRLFCYKNTQLIEELVHMNDTWDQEINNLKSVNSDYKRKFEEFLSVRRSARLFVGNVKRAIMFKLKR